LELGDPPPINDTQLKAPRVVYVKSMRGRTKFFQLTLVAVALIAFASCSNSSANTADTHAAAACRISKQSDGTYSAPAIPDDEKRWRLDDDLGILSSVAATWTNLASEAAAAAQEDSGYGTLAAVASDVAAMRRDVVTTRKAASWATTIGEIQSLKDWSYLVDNYNLQLTKYQTECNGLSTQLSD
jgi:hypothetical protein